MEKGIALNALSRSSSLNFIRSPKSELRSKLARADANFFTGLQLKPDRSNINYGRGRKIGMTVQAMGKGRRGMAERLYKRPVPPSIPMPTDDNPRFLLFVRTIKVPRWYPLSIITGGTTAKLMVAAKDTFIGKRIYESTITRNIAGVVYRDEKKIRKIVLKQYPVLKAASGFQYGFKLIDPDNPNSAIYPSNVIKIPPQEELKPVVEKVKDFFANGISGVKESFGSISNLNIAAEADEATPKKEEKS
ncbi:hypothetical protein KI387_034895, partial [Taxus chinensis]